MSDLRSKLIRVAASMPEGSAERKTLLASLKIGKKVSLTFTEHADVKLTIEGKDEKDFFKKGEGIKGEVVSENSKVYVVKDQRGYTYEVPKKSVKTASDRTALTPKIEGEALVEVFGWVMLKGVEDGKYRVQNRGDGTYQFYKPRGSRAIARHYINKVDPFIGSPDQNRIEIIRVLSKVASSVRVAGGRDMPGDSMRLDARQLLKDVLSVGFHTKEHIAKYDFNKVLWNPVRSHTSDRTGRLTMEWFAYPIGDFANKTTGRKGDYIYGYVTATLEPTNDVGGDLTLVLMNTVKSY